MPDHIVRKVEGKRYSFPVYTKKEADERNLTYVEWRDARQGDWAISDDGYVALCLRRALYTERTGRSKECLYLVHGTFWLPYRQEFSYIRRKETGSFQCSTDKPWQEREAHSQRVKRTIRAYIDMFLEYEKIDWVKLGNIYRPDQEIPEATVKRLFKEDKITELVAQGIADVMLLKGITRASVIAKFEKAYNIALDNEEPGHMINVADKYAKMLKMYDDSPSHNPDEIDSGNSRAMDAIFDDIKKIEAGNGQ